MLYLTSCRGFTFVGLPRSTSIPFPVSPNGSNFRTPTRQSPSSSPSRARNHGFLSHGTQPTRPTSPSQACRRIACSFSNTGTDKWAPLHSSRKMLRWQNHHLWQDPSVQRTRHNKQQSSTLVHLDLVRGNDFAIKAFSEIDRETSTYQYRYCWRSTRESELMTCSTQGWRTSWLSSTTTKECCLYAGASLTRSYEILFYFFWVLKL